MTDPNTEPWETPVFNEFLINWPFKIGLWRLLWKNNSIRSRRLPFIPLLFNLFKRPLYQTLSNVFDKYKTTPWSSNERFSSNALKTLWAIEISWLTQNSFDLKLDWLLLRRLFSITNLKIARNTSFSKSWEHIRSKDARW